MVSKYILKVHDNPCDCSICMPHMLSVCTIIMMYHSSVSPDQLFPAEYLGIGILLFGNEAYDLPLVCITESLIYGIVFLIFVISY